MKMLKRSYRGIVAAGAIALFAAATASPALADHWGPRYHGAEHEGYWDHHHYYRHYGSYRGHRGYWDERSGVRVWINI